MAIIIFNGIITAVVVVATVLAELNRRRIRRQLATKVTSYETSDFTYGIYPDGKALNMSWTESYRVEK